jgi:hypothetical protein
LVSYTVYTRDHQCAIVVASVRAVDRRGAASRRARAATIDRRRARALASRARVESLARRRLRGRDDATTRERRRDDG